MMAVILAAGEGKRMKSSVTKAAHRICGKALIELVYEAACGAGALKCVVVVGYKAEQVMGCLGGKAEYVMQEKQLGTGHAVMQARRMIESGGSGDILVLYGDTPLITSGTLKKALECHKKSGNAVTVITAAVEDPTGYGRIIRNAEGGLSGIVEQRDATENQKKINEINSGMYCFSRDELLDALDELTNNNDQGEYYLTDTITIIRDKGKRAGAYMVSDSTEIAGINDRIQLAAAAAVIRTRIAKAIMLEGVTVEDPDAVYIDAGVKIGTDTVIRPGTTIEGSTVIGAGCVIGPGTTVADSAIGDGCRIYRSVVTGSRIASGSEIGPFRYLHDLCGSGDDINESAR